ncbi:MULTISPECIES: hypothetical protein [unclassified Mesorhizobium]|uniref:hypothetical protein n=1 Tax=unclassified Mesorhizobium TaxID=325217 RepID=UPI00112ECF03|nr:MULTISPECIES: hypothetical protein [unclassified Mesorhizobium]MBZ9702500.1 hypothetical protein [Mesorhizobium sp. CO1-1-3]MBZ9948784.1 hypothetical protein [Mesorhizobium sp. BR1-1-11]TPJ09598.1 hypothetical protein FJ428_02915 [Mesorhizobium sp. B2-8-1]
MFEQNFGQELLMVSSISSTLAVAFRWGESAILFFLFLTISVNPDLFEHPGRGRRRRPDHAKTQELFA